MPTTTAIVELPEKVYLQPCILKDHQTDFYPTLYMAKQTIME